MSFLVSIENGIRSAKTAVVHFFTDTKAGQTIEHVVLDVVSVPGFKDWLTKFETTAKDDLKAALTAIENPTSESVATVIEQQITKLISDGKTAVANGLLTASHGSWANLLITVAYTALKAEIPALLTL